MFSLTGRTLVWGQRFRQSYCCGGAFQPCLWGWGDVRRAGSFGGPPPTAEHLPRSLLCFLVDCRGGQTAWLGERRGSHPGRGGDREGLQARSSPGVRGTWDGVGQGIEGRLSPGPQAVDEHSGHQGPLQLGMGRGRSPVHAAVHGGGGRRSRSAVHAAQQAWVVEIRRWKHPLQCRVIPCLSQQLQAHRGLPLPLGPEKKADVRAPHGWGAQSRPQGLSFPLAGLFFLGEDKEDLERAENCEGTTPPGPHPTLSLTESLKPKPVSQTDIHKYISPSFAAFSWLFALLLPSL